MEPRSACLEIISAYHVPKRKPENCKKKYTVITRVYDLLLQNLTGDLKFNELVSKTEREKDS